MLWNYCSCGGNLQTQKHKTSEALLYRGQNNRLALLNALLLASFCTQLKVRLVSYMSCSVGWPDVYFSPDMSSFINLILTHCHVILKTCNNIFLFHDNCKFMKNYFWSADKWRNNLNLLFIFRNRNRCKRCVWNTAAWLWAWTCNSARTASVVLKLSPLIYNCIPRYLLTFCNVTVARPEKEANQAPCLCPPITSFDL